MQVSNPPCGDDSQSQPLVPAGVLQSTHPWKRETRNLTMGCLPDPANSQGYIGQEGGWYHTRP